MKVEAIISKSYSLIGIVSAVAGGALTGVAFALKIGVAGALLPLAAGVIGAAFAFSRKGALKEELLDHIRNLTLNTDKMSKGEASDLMDTTDAPEDFKAINDNLQSTIHKIATLTEELKNEKSVRESDLAAFENIYGAMMEDGDSSGRVNKIVDKIKKIGKFDRYFLFIKDPQAQMLNRENTTDGEDGPLQNIILKDRKNKIIEILSKGEPQLIEDTAAEKNLPDPIKNWARKNNIAGIFVVPIATGQEPYGVVLYSVQKDQPVTRTCRLVASLGMYAMGEIYAFNNKVRETKDHSSTLERENNIYTSLLEVSKFKDLCANFIFAFGKLVPLDWGAISVFDQDQNAYMMYSAKAGEDITAMKRSVIPINGSGIFWVKENWKSWVEEDLTKTKPFSEDELYVHNGLKARVITPLYSEKRFVGALSVASAKEGAFTPEQVKIIEKVAGQLGPVLENARLVSQLNRKIEELNDENQKLRKFYHNLGHEMRNPLNILRNIATVADEKSNSMTPQQIDDALGYISQKTKYLTKAIEEVLDFSKSQLGKVDYNPEEFFLIEVLKDVLWEYQDEAKEKMLSLKWDVPKEMPEISGDREKMRTVFKELIGNAIKYTPEKGTITLKANLIPKLWVKTKAQEFFPAEIIGDVDAEVDQVVISITNTGPGIPEEKQKNLFRPPTEVPDKIRDEKGGLGLGLTKVKQMVDLHRGMIWVVSQEGATRFTFNLPQYGRSWSILRTMLADKIDKAKQTLASLTVITISLQDADELKQMLPEARYSQLLKDIEKTVRSTIRDPRDVVWRLYDDETIILISQLDIKKAAPLKDRIAENIREMKSTVLKEPPEVEFTSLTYPDEVLTANELIGHLDKLIREKQEEE